MIWEDQGNGTLEVAFVTANLPKDPQKREQATWMMLFPSTFPRAYRTAKAILAEEWDLPIWPREQARAPEVKEATGG